MDIFLRMVGVSLPKSTKTILIVKIGPILLALNVIMATISISVENVLFLIHFARQLTQKPVTVCRALMVML
jgi:hypothetical protein